MASTSPQAKKVALLENRAVLTVLLELIQCFVQRVVGRIINSSLLLFQALGAWLTFAATDLATTLRIAKQKVSVVSPSTGCVFGSKR